jgi:DegV family protein with EDD domain
MSKVAIVTDSTSYIPKPILQQHKIEVIPQVLVWGNETLRDGVDITPEEFYRRLQKASQMPSSSQATPGEFKEVFAKLLDDGYDVLAILISSKLSGTVDSAIQAKAMYPDASIEVVDSYSTSMAMGYQVLLAARAAEQGASLEECKEIAVKTCGMTGIVLTVDTLEFLHRGGRIGGGKRFLGTVLNIKPILELEDGKIEGVEQVRTRSKAINRLVELAEERIKGRTPVHIACLHANAPDEAQALLDQTCQRIKVVEKTVTDVSPVIGAHVGPGTLGITFLAGM